MIAKEAREKNHSTEDTAFERLLAQTSDVVDSVAVYLSWQELLHVMGSCHAAFPSGFRREFERKTRLVVPPDARKWTKSTAWCGQSRPRWSAVSIPHTSLLGEDPEAFSSLRNVVVEPHRYMLQLTLASSAMDFTRLHGSFPQLEELDLSGISDLVDISSLVCLVDLRCLDLSGTGVDNLSSISHLRRLITLNVSKTRITTLGPLRGLPELATLHLDAATQLCSLEPLESLPSLKALTVRQVRCDQAIEQLTTVAPRLVEFACCSKLLQSSRMDVRYEVFGRLLKAMISVESLELASNVTLDVDFDDMVTLTRLRRLHMSVLHTLELFALLPLADLQELSITSSRCVDLSALAALPKLRYLYCHGGDPDSMDAITSGSPGIALPRLKQLDASNHYLARFTSLPKLEDLKVYLWSGDTLMLPIGCAKKLGRFQLSGDMDLREIHTRFPHLEGLELRQCSSFDAVDITLFENLQFLAFNDPSTAIVFPADQLIPRLRVLRLRGASVQHLPQLSSVPNLLELDLEKSGIRNLDLIKSLTKLQMLNLKGTLVRDVTPLLSMTSLEKIVLPKSAVCTPLVAAYHDASPAYRLRQVLHPTKNCLWGPHNRARRKPDRGSFDPETVRPSTVQNAALFLSQAVDKCSLMGR